jgi:hypothetical protein
VVHLAFFSGNGEARWLAHIHLLLEVAVEEGGLDVHVVNTPPFLSRQRKEDLDRLHACHSGEGIVIVDPVLLDKAAHYQPRLVLDHRALLVLLELEHPLKSDGAVAAEQWHQLPSAVLLDGLKHLLHRRPPHWITLCLSISGRLTGVRQMKLGEEPLYRVRRRLVSEDVCHGAVQERLVVVLVVQPVLIILQRRRILDLRLPCMC